MQALGGLASVLEERWGHKRSAEENNLHSSEATKTRCEAILTKLEASNPDGSWLWTSIKKLESKLVDKWQVPRAQQPATRELSIIGEIIWPHTPTLVGRSCLVVPYPWIGDLGMSAAEGEPSL